MNQTLASEYFQTRAAHDMAEDAINEQLRVIFAVPPEEWWWEDFTCDEVDWDGTSVELKDVRPGLVPTDEQLEGIWAMGFTVVRVDYEGYQQRQVPMNGEWWRVKGLPAGQCPCRQHSQSEAVVTA